MEDEAHGGGCGVQDTTLYLATTFSINLYRGISWHAAQSAAKLRNAKLAEEAERAALEATQRRAKESAEKEAARIAEVSASEEAKKKSMDHNNKESNERILVLEPKQVQLSNDDGALRAEANS